MFMHIYLCSVVVTASLGVGGFRSRIAGFNKVSTDPNNNAVAVEFR
jgi:hypothetical protein